MFLGGKLGRLLKSGQQHYQAGMILPVVQSEALTKDTNFSGIIRQLRDLCDLSEEYFSLLYEATLEYFAAYVQVLPSKMENNLCSLWIEGLARAVMALKIYFDENPEGHDPLYIFAVFSAALLAELGHLVTHQRIIICDEAGQYIDDWRPFEGPLTKCADFYRFYPLSVAYQRLDVAVTQQMVRQILPHVAFVWLTSDLLVYADWLDALAGDARQGGRIARALSLVRREDIYSLIHSLDAIKLETTFSEENQLAETFFTWLKEGIGQGNIKINSTDAGLHITKEGVFLEQHKLFQQFVDEVQKPVRDTTVFAQFGNLMGVAKKGGYDYAHAQFFSDFSVDPNMTSGVAFASPISQPKKTIREGMLLADPAMIFVNSQVPAVSPLLRELQIKGAQHHALPLILNDPQLQQKNKNSLDR